MATKSKKTVTETSNANDPCVIKFSDKWAVTLQGMKKKDLWSVLIDLQNTLHEQGVIKSIPSEEEDKKMYKSMTGKEIIHNIIMSAQQEMNALVMTVYLEKITGTKEENVEDKNKDYDALINDAEKEDIRVKNQRQGKEIAEALKAEIEATVSYVEARHSDDPVVKEAVKEYEQEMIKEAKDAGALLGTGRVNRTGLNKNGTKSKKKVGVIASIADILIATTKPLTKDEILNQLMERFPDRDSSAMETTVGVQVPARMSREKNMDIVKVDCGTNGLTNRTIWGYMMNCDSLECVDEVNGYYELK